MLRRKETINLNATSLRQTLVNLQDPLEKKPAAMARSNTVRTDAVQMASSRICVRTFSHVLTVAICKK